MTYQEAKENFKYDPITGVLTRIKPPSSGTAILNTPITTKDSGGRLQVKFKGVTYMVHRVAWMLAYGAWPEAELDHINRDKTDNRLANLRDVTPSVNCRNRPIRPDNTSGCVGVSQLPSGKWKAYITGRSGHEYLGSFEQYEDAVSARKSKEVEYGYLV